MYRLLAAQRQTGEHRRLQIHPAPRPSPTSRGRPRVDLRADERIRNVKRKTPAYGISRKVQLQIL